MDREIEVKFRLPDPEAFRRTLRECGAERIGHDHEINRILNDESGTLARDGALLRVRELGGDGRAGEARLTYKGPRTGDAVKVREEIETTTGDATALRLILGRLGFRETVRYEKRRETWRCSGCWVTIDQLPVIGHFGEIEGESIEQVQSVRRRLGVEDAQVETDSYVGLTVRHGSLTEYGGRELSF